MHLCAFRPHNQNASGLGLSASAEFNHFRRASPAPSTDIAAIANAFA